MPTKCEMLLQAIEAYALIMLNGEGRIELCNKVTGSITGFSCHELYGQPFYMLYTNEDRNVKRCENDLSLTLKEGTHTSESWKLKGNGSRY